MWNSARKRKENEYSSRERDTPLAAMENGEEYKKKKSREMAGVVGRAPFTVFSTWAGVNYLDVV